MPNSVAPPPTRLEQPPLARRILDALPMTIWSVDLEGRITAANQAWSAFAADNGAPDIAPEPSVIGTSIFDGITDDDARIQLELALSALRDGTTPMARWEFPCNSPDEERVFLMQVTALRQREGVVGYVFATVDITPSHRSREALINTGIALAEGIEVTRIYEEVTRQVRRAIPSTGFLIALADDASAAFRVVHEEGYGDVQVDGTTYQRLTRTWLDAIATGSVLREAAESSLEITAPLLSGEGVLGAITLRAEPMESAQRLEEAERVLAVIAAQTAVAIERAWLVRRVEHKRRLEAIGEVAAGVAHELRNPLFGISSAAQMLRLRVAQDPVVDKNVGRILGEVDRLNRMVTSLLQFGRPVSPHPVATDPDTIWDELLDAERARLEAKHLQLERTRAAASGQCVVDAGQIGQVFRNILENACDAAPDGSTLRLVSQWLPTGAWRCRLTNGGPAIPPDTLPHVFEFFFSAKAGGTGIGLALCQRIMDDHGGTITIESVPEQGTTLTLVIPAGGA